MRNKKWQRKVHETGLGYLIFLQEVADHAHFEHMSWLSICFLCTWWTSCFTPCLMQQVLF